MRISDLPGKNERTLKQWNRSGGRWEPDGDYLARITKRRVVGNMASRDHKMFEASLIRADKVYRRKVIIVYIIVGAIGVATIGWGLPWMQEHVENLNPEEALQFMKVALVMMFLGVLPIAFYLLTFGRKVIVAERFPPPGTRVIRDTVLLEGEKAKQRGRWVVLLSLILALLGLFGALYAQHLVDRVATRGTDTTENGGAK